MTSLQKEFWVGTPVNSIWMLKESVEPFMMRVTGNVRSDSKGFVLGLEMELLSGKAPKACNKESGKITYHEVGSILVESKENLLNKSLYERMK